MPRKTYDLEFPAAGVVRLRGLRSVASGRGPYPAPWATNVRLEDSLTNRLRGGSFTAVAAGARPSAVYRDRTLKIVSNAIHCSRQGVPTNYQYSVDVSDTARATVFQLSDADAVGGTVVALAPHKDGHLICWTADETWVLAGDPTTGSLRRVSPEVGIIASGAWCVNHDTVYFLSSRGLYSMGVDGSGLTPISENAIPDDLIGISDSACTLTYDHATRGVYIHLTSGVSWLYDTARNGFWPFVTTTTDSHVLFGPFQLGNRSHYGRVLNLHGNIASGSADVTWRLVVGDTAETAAANGKAAIEAAVAGSSYTTYVASSGTWSAGRAHMQYPRTRAIYCCLWLHSTGTWAFEQALMTATVSGQWR